MAEHSYDTPTPTKNRPKSAANEHAFPNIQSGRFKFIAVIGHGGAGTVFHALDTILNKEVAIKKLHSASPEQSMRFQREAKLAGALKHENVLSALDFGVTEENEPYLILDYENGDSLTSYIKRVGRLPVKEALNIAIQIASGLHHAHKNGVIHRDIKPSNVILVDKDKITDTQLFDTGSRSSLIKISGTQIAKIVDFGLAKSVNEEQELTQVGTGLGTPKYMSPEQVHGIEVDERSDIYSLGCLMFEILTGKVPFQGQTSWATLDMHLNVPPPSMASKGLECSEDLELIVSICLSKDPDDRFQSAGDLVNKLTRELEDIEKNEQLEAAIHAEVAPADAEQTIGTIKNNKHLLILGAGLSILMVLVAVLVWHDNDPPKEPLPKRTVKKIGYESFFNSKESRVSEDHDLLSDGYRFRTNHATDKDIKSFLKGNIKGKIVDSLDLSDSNVGRAAFQALADKTKITKLSYTMHPINKSTLSNVALITTLKDLRLGGIKKPIEPNSIIELAPLKNLKFLYIGQTKLDDRAFEDLSHVTSLTVLEFTGCTGVTFHGLEQLLKLKDLEHLKLSSTDTTDQALSAVIKNHPRLCKLVLRGTNVTDKSIDGLAKMRLLQEIDLTDCKGVTLAGVERLKKNRLNKSTKYSLEYGQRKLIQTEGLDKYHSDLD